jgi:hypothetical protein
MAIKTTGSLALSEIAAEVSDAQPHSMSEFYAGGGKFSAGLSGTNGALPSSGQISFSQFYGISNVVIKTVSITLYGGEGGSSDGVGGQGGTTVWSGTIIEGVSLLIYVGGKGSNGPADGRSSGGGGGGSAVFASGTLLAVAGGGGGSGTIVSGGSGGGSSGGGGGSSQGGGGSGGSQGGAGAGGDGNRWGSNPGSGINGGNGVGSGIAAVHPGAYGYGSGGYGVRDPGDGGAGGGGGGYFGGGSGGGSSDGGGAGGGSGYIRTSGFTNVTYSSASTSNGGKTGNGQVIVTVNGAPTTYNFTGGTQSRTV